MYIIAKTSDKNVGRSSGGTPLHCAAYTGNLDIFRLIFEKVEIKNPVDTRGW